MFKCLKQWLNNIRGRDAESIKQRDIDIWTHNLYDTFVNERYARNLEEGVETLRSGRKVKVYNAPRSEELAYEIKRRYLLDCLKTIDDRVKIDKAEEAITICIIPSCPW